MKHEFQLQEQDFLDFQLFSASKSERINKKKRTELIFLAAGSIIVGLYFFLHGNLTMTIYFVIVTISVLLFYPKYFKWRYRKHYAIYIKENYSKRFGEQETIEINSDHILTMDKTGEGKINISEIEEITETTKHFFLKISTGMALIIPKDGVENLESLRKELKYINIPINEELNWKWK